MMTGACQQYPSQPATKVWQPPGQDPPTIIAIYMQGAQGPEEGITASQ